VAQRVVGVGGGPIGAPCRVGLDDRDEIAQDVDLLSLPLAGGVGDADQIAGVGAVGGEVFGGSDAAVDGGDADGASAAVIGVGGGPDARAVGGVGRRDAVEFAERRAGAEGILGIDLRNGRVGSGAVAGFDARDAAVVPVPRVAVCWFGW